MASSTFPTHARYAPRPYLRLNAHTCRNSNGSHPASSQDGVDGGELFNGMLMPFANMTIKGALWYQGENNLGDCFGPGNQDIGDGRTAPGGGPRASGVANEATGYACEILNLVKDWRSAFGKAFPFGIVTLACGTDEGQPYNMAAMRYAQTSNQGFLPSKTMPGTFSANAFDLGDPVRSRVVC